MKWQAKPAVKLLVSFQWKGIQSIYRHLLVINVGYAIGIYNFDGVESIQKREIFIN